MRLPYGCHNRRGGFTLVELLVAMAIAATLMLVFLGILRLTSGVYRRVSLERQRGSTELEAMMVLHSDLKEAIAIYPITPSGAYHTHMGMVIQQMAPIGSKETYNYVYYRLESQVLRRYAIKSNRDRLEGVHLLSGRAGNNAVLRQVEEANATWDVSRHIWWIRLKKIGSKERVWAFYWPEKEGAHER